MLLSASAGGLSGSAFDGGIAARTSVAALDAAGTATTGGAGGANPPAVEAAAVVPSTALRDTLKVLGRPTAVTLSITDGRVEVLTSTGSTHLPAVGEVSQYLQLPTRVEISCSA